MSLKEIEKMREKVEKDPNSKLYVPLAEEYRKVGMLDEAVEVLKKGLEKQPGYMSARVSLGKIYLEKGQMDEARVEFENVVKLIPDNLYAQKKLAEIYRDTGKNDLAIKSFRTFLNLNPMDEDALNNLRQLEGTNAEPHEEKTEGPVPRISEPAAAEEEIPFQPMSLEQTAHEQAEADTEEPGEELDAFKQSLFGFRGETGDENTEEPLAAEEEISEGEASTEEDAEEWSFGDMEDDQAISAVGEADVEPDEKDNEEMPEEASEKFSFGEIESGPEVGSVEEAPTETVEEDTIEIEEAAEVVGEELSFGDIADVLKIDTSEEVEKPEPATNEIYKAKSSFEADNIIPADNSVLLQNADSFISEGNYLGAINIYQRILAASPDDKKTFQRVEELRSLLKLMGKEKEVLISKLNAFQSAIEKRGDEFFGRS
jgi:tetratricopeptide (TPR) repeat protein